MELALALELPEIDNLTLFLVLGSVAAALVSMGKAGFGGSVGLLSTPLMIIACGDRTRLSLGIMLPLLILCDYVSMVAWWRRWNARAALGLVPGLLVGLVIGFFLFKAMARLDAGAAAGPGSADALLMLCVGLIALGFVVLKLIRRGADQAARRPLRTWEVGAVGTAGGVTTMLAHAAGPIITIYMLRRNMPKERFVASTTLFYWMGNQIKVPFYIVLGMLDKDTAMAALLLSPAVVVGALLGVFLNRRVPQAHFATVVHVLLAVAGGHLVYKAIAAFAG